MAVVKRLISVEYKKYILIVQFNLTSHLIHFWRYTKKTKSNSSVGSQMHDITGLLLKMDQQQPIVIHTILKVYMCVLSSIHDLDQC